MLFVSPTHHYGPTERGPGSPRHLRDFPALNLSMAVSTRPEAPSASRSAHSAASASAAPEQPFHHPNRHARAAAISPCIARSSLPLRLASEPLDFLAVARLRMRQAVLESI